MYGAIRKSCRMLVFFLFQVQNSFARQNRRCFGTMLIFFSVLCRDVLKSLSEHANDMTHVKIIVRLIRVRDGPLEK